LELQQGSKRVNPDELTEVSDSGLRTPLTPLRLQGRRVFGFPHPNFSQKKATSMYSFTAQQRFSALIWLSLFHIAIITSSNYLVQLLPT